MHSEVSSLESVGLSDPEPATRAYFAHLVKSPITAPSYSKDMEKGRMLREKKTKKYIFGESKASKESAFERIDVGPAKQMRQKILAASLFPSVYAN